MTEVKASTENILILAILIIVALVVAAVLGGFINPTASFLEEESQDYWKTADFGIVDCIVSGSSIALLVQNNMNYSVGLNYVSVDGRNLTFGLGGEVSPGAHQLVGGTGPYCPNGSRYSYNISIGYDSREFGVFNQVFNGTRALIGAC